MAKLKCKCGNTYLAKVSVNEFHDLPGSLHTPLMEVEVDYDIKMYQCISCKSYILPPIDYYGTTDAIKRLYNNLSIIIDGGQIPRDKDEYNKPIRPGSAGKIDFVKRDPSEHGKFVRQ